MTGNIFPLPRKGSTSLSIYFLKSISIVVQIMLDPQPTEQISHLDN